MVVASSSSSEEDEESVVFLEVFDGEKRMFSRAVWAFDGVVGSQVPNDDRELSEEDEEDEEDEEVEEVVDFEGGGGG